MTYADALLAEPQLRASLTPPPSVRQGDQSRFHLASGHPCGRYLCSSLCNGCKDCLCLYYSYLLSFRDIRYRERPLLFARADAEEVAAVLHHSNALQIENGNLTLLVNASATQENVWRSLNTVFATNRNFDQDTIAFFYFAGHGVIDPIEGDNIILGCHDVEHMNPNKGGVRLNDIFRLVQRTSAGSSIAIIDACFSGAIFDPKHIDHESPAQLARRAIALVKGDGDKTIAIFTACSPDQVAREDLEVGHGVYTQELLRGLRDGEARDEHGVVGLSGLATLHDPHTHLRRVR